MKFIDLFAGIGGFRRGMELAGHKCVGFCEFDQNAVASYTMMHLATQEQREYIASIPAPLKKNGQTNFKKRQQEVLKNEYKNGEWYAGDIRSVDAGSVPRADCWCFGFPCQDISITGNRLGFAGKRSSLFFAVTKLIRDLPEKNRPTYLFIENVKNLLSVNRGFDFAKILIELDEIGYDAEWEVFNSKYFGVPQNRERVFIVGHFRGRSTRKVFPLGETDRLHNARRPDKKMDHIARCLTAGGYDKWQGDYIVKQNRRIRRLTPRECFRLQGWTDEYFDRAALVNLDSKLYSQAGNGVTVNVIQAIAERMEKVFDQIMGEIKKRINLQLKLISMIRDDQIVYGYIKCLEAYQQAKLIVEQVAENYNNGWAFSNQKLPPDPKEKLLSGEDLENAIERGEIEEYLVTIRGAGVTSTLYYIGDNTWYDYVTGDTYPVTAWMPMPEAPRSKGEKA